jgi:two-component system NtrC family sensor kinase
MECDPDQLQQVFINLIMNALDAMTPEAGSLEVRAALEYENGDARVARITFEDTGPGIPIENRARVFDPFFTTKDVGKGTGMGLAVSQSIVRDHDGEITLETGPAGTRFTISLPITSRGVHSHAGVITDSSG